MINLNLKGMDGLLKHMENRKTGIAKEVVNEIEATGRDIERLAKRAAPKDTGRLAATIGAYQVKDGVQVRGSAVRPALS